MGIRPRSRERGAMDENTTRTAVPAGSIVVGVDGSDCAAQAVAWAADQAVLESRRLVLLHAADSMSTTTSMWLTSMAVDPTEVRRDIEAGGRDLLARTAAELGTSHPSVELVEVLQQVDPRLALIEASAVAHTTVVGSHGRGPVSGLLLGSVGVAVARHAKGPVVVVRPGSPNAPRHGVIVGVDGTERSLPALEAAYRHASVRRLPLTVVHCFWDVIAATTPGHIVPSAGADTEDLRRLVGESVAGMSEKFPDVPVTIELARGLAEEVLGRESAEHDLVVVGHHRTGPVTALLRGSVSTAVVEHATCPVLVVPSTD
ncbi:universal stress protein [Nocardioides sp. zg-579]|uniref:Universal stress protein n=2 Tax=Nocardioides marmotae TaxID=2663857 RepID=A0A6I3JGI5_9ACTN|nr:universal stress protein [Gordonia jinghuaiqii]MTB97261.1 universal stress protein [Nocardioides marmotae]